MTTASEYIQQPTFRVITKKIQIKLNDHYPKQLNYSAGLHSKNHFLAIRYIHPAFQKTLHLEIKNINNQIVLSDQQKQLVDLAMKFNRKRERFNQNTFYL
jgi:hypothetical protein